MEQPEQNDAEGTWNTEADTFIPIHSRQRAAAVIKTERRASVKGMTDQQRHTGYKIVVPLSSSSAGRYF